MKRLELGSKKCLYCGVNMERKYYGNKILEQAERFRKRKFCCRLHARKWNSGPRSSGWKGGISFYKSGYVVESSTKKGIHRIVMEKFIGRPLKKKEVVHHIDHNKSNNAISNLKIMSQAEHARIHAPGRIANMGEKKCAQCGRKYVRKRWPSGEMLGRTHFLKRKFCSQRCSQRWRIGDRNQNSKLVHERQKRS